MPVTTLDPTTARIVIDLQAHDRHTSMACRAGGESLS